MLLNDILFYGGIIMGIITILIAIILFVIFYINKIKLNIKFDEEYGKQPQIKKD